MPNTLLDSATVPEQLKTQLRVFYADPNTKKIVEEKRNQLVAEIEALGYKASGDFIYDLENQQMKVNLKSFNHIMRDLIFFRNENAIRDLIDIIKNELSIEQNKT